MGRLALAAVLLAVVACATVPITGRTQLQLVSEDALAAAADRQFATLMQEATSKGAVLSRTESPQAATLLDTIDRVSGRLLDAAGVRSLRPWQVVVLKSKAANAFVIPNGRIVVFTGIVPIAKNEAGLAAVLGHEIAHAVARHQAERVSQALLVQTGLSAANAVFASTNQKYAPLIAAALGLGAQYGLLLPFSREHESEADHIGLIYMAKAGYTPSEAPAFWERMAAGAGTGPWEFLSTHPSPATRIAQLTAWMPEATEYYADRSRNVPASLVAGAPADDAQGRRRAGTLTQVSPQSLAAPSAARPRPACGWGMYWNSAKGQCLKIGEE